MSHAGFRVVASVGIVTLTSACASRQTTDAPASAIEPGSVSAVANAGEPSPTGELSAADEGGAEPLTPASGRIEQAEASDCPMQIREVELSTLPAMSGVAFLFTTKSQASLDELRRRVLALHDAYAQGLLPSAAAMSDLVAKTTIETSVDYTDERNGARIEVRAIHQNDIDELRRRLREDTTAMTDQRRCPALAGARAPEGATP